MSMSNNASIILNEHRNIVFSRYLLTLINFVVILAGSLTTLFLVLRKGSPDYILVCAYLTIGLNALQIILCATDFCLRFFMGIYTRILTVFIYLVGACWLLVIISSVALFYFDSGFLRTDLLIIAVVQIIVAVMAYIIGPGLDRKSLNSFVRQDVRTNAAKRKSTSKIYIRAYAVLSVCIIFAQALTLLAYKIPPRVYDIFSDTRALQYELNADGNAYIVTGVYNGTSTQVNIPRLYNNKPVIGIASGAFVEDDLFTVNKIDSITFGTSETADDGTVKTVSELLYIESNAIVNNQITTLDLPESIESISENAISGNALTTIKYSCKASFSANNFNADSVKTIVLSGDNVGRIESLSGINTNVSIQVDKEIYNEYRKQNPQYVQSFQPILDENEFCIDFYTDCDYYVESIIASAGTTVNLGYEDLVGDNNTGKPISVDTLAYIRNNQEVATDGAKEGYAFRGWYYDANFTRECKFTESETLSFNKSTTLYAKWAKEYTADLDWGTYTPENAEKRIYWAEGETIIMPKAESVRNGFEAGVKWISTDSEEINNTAGIRRNLSLSALWVLDTPEIDIERNPSDMNFDLGEQIVRFTYDENRTLTLKAQGSHSIDVSFLYRWECADSLRSEFSSIILQNVPDQGNYILTVVAVAPTGERSQASTSLTVEIDKKPLEKGTASISENYYLVYNGERQSISALSVPDDIAVHLDFVKDGITVSEGFIDEENIGVIGVGNYTLTATYQKKTVAATANYQVLTEVAAFEVAPKALTNFVWVGNWQNESDNNRETEYSGDQFGVNITFDGVLGDDQVIPTYEVIGGDASGYKNVGTYTTILTGIDNANYSIEGCTNLTHEWKIVPRIVSVQSWSLDAGSESSVIYNANTHTVSATIDRLVAADIGNTAFIYSGAVSGKDAGIYNASVIGINNANYELNSEDVNNSYSWEITRKILTASFTGTEELVYNGNKQTVSLVLNNFAGRDYESFAMTSFDNIQGSGAEISFVNNTNGQCRIEFRIMDAGKYTLSVDGLSGDDGVLKNYSFFGANTTVSMSKKLLVPEVTKGYVYDGTEQTLSVKYSGFYNNDANNVTFTGLVGEPSSDGKTYNIYTIGTEADEYTLLIDENAINSRNYYIYTYNAQLSIGKRPLSLEDYGYNNLSKPTSAIYNGTTFNCYAKFGNFASVDVPETVFQVEVSQGVSIKNVGNYSLTIELSLLTEAMGERLKNYVFEQTIYEFAIFPKSVIPTWSFDETPDGGTNNTFIYKASPIYYPTVSFGDQIISGDSVSAQYDKSGSETHSGTYSITITGLNNANYKVADGYATYSWSIKPKQLSLNWTQADSYVYNGKYQAPELFVTGIFESDSVQFYVEGNENIGKTVNIVSGQGIIDIFVDAGQYVLEVVSVNSEDYVLPDNNLSRGYEIQKATLNLVGWEWSNSISYSSDNRSAGFNSLVYRNSAYTVSNKISDTTERLGVPIDVSLLYEGNIASNVGSYSAKITGITGGHAMNFNLPADGLECIWAIKPKAIYLTWGVTSLTYNAEVRNVTATYSTGASSDTDGRIYAQDKVTLSYSGNAYTNANTYTAVATLATGGENYILDQSTASTLWTIKPYELSSCTWSDMSFVYNGKNQYPKASFDFLSNADNITISYEYPENAIEVGEKTIKVTGITGISASNYTISESAKSEFNYTILPLTVQLSWGYLRDGGSGIRPVIGAGDFVYDGKSVTFTAEVINKARVDDSFTLTYNSANTLTNAGEYNIRVASLSNSNYALDGAESVSINIKIAPRVLKFAWENDRDQIYAPTGYTVKAIPTNLVAQDAISNITYSGSNHFVARGNYEISISGIDFAESTLSSNYNWIDEASISTNINITPRPVNITWSNLEVTYSGAPQMPTVNIVGTDGVLIGSDEYTIVSHDGEAVNVGTYSFEVVLNEASNYTLTGATGQVKCDFMITKRELNVFWWGEEGINSFTGIIDGAEGYAVDVQIDELASQSFSILYKKADEVDEFVPLENGVLYETGFYTIKLELTEEYDINYRLINYEVTLELIN